MTEHLSSAQYRAAVGLDKGKRKKVNKFGAIRAYRCAGCGLTVLAPNSSCDICHGVKILNFASRAEAARYDLLRSLQKLGKIFDLEWQVPYEIAIEGHGIAKYIADFRYRDEAGRIRVEDVKGGPTHTPLSKLKIALVSAQHGITVEIVR